LTVSTASNGRQASFPSLRRLYTWNDVPIRVITTHLRRHSTSRHSCSPVHTWAVSHSTYFPKPSVDQVSRNAPERRSGARKFKPGAFRLQNYCIWPPERTFLGQAS